MKEAIKKAIEGGYKVNGLVLEKGELFAFGRPDQQKIEQYCLLDPLFWQCLGKHEGWNERKVTMNLSEMEISSVGREKFTRPKQSPSYIRKTPNRWKNEWHRFIDHLAEGKDIDSFFESLLQ